MQIVGAAALLEDEALALRIRLASADPAAVARRLIYVAACRAQFLLITVAGKG